MGGLQLNCLGTEFLEGLHDVGGLDTLEVVTSRGENTVGHGGDDAVLDKLLYPTGIAEVGQLLGEGLDNSLPQFAPTASSVRMYSSCSKMRVAMSINSSSL